MSTVTTTRVAATPPTYRERLRLEGLVLAGSCAVAGVVVALVGDPKLDLLYAAQVVIGIGLLAFYGPRFARKAMARADRVDPGQAGSGEPTPLWHLLAIVAVITPLATVLSGGIAGLGFVTSAGTVGLAQAFVIAPAVAREERRTGRSHVRRPGSRIARGTKLGWF